MTLLLEPRHELTTWQVVIAVLTRAWLKVSNSPPELAEGLMAFLTLWWGIGILLIGHAWGIAFIVLAIWKFVAVALDLYCDTMRFRLLAGILILAAWAFTTSQFAGSNPVYWINSASILTSGAMLMQGGIFARQVAIWYDAWRKHRARHALA